MTDQPTYDQLSALCAQMAAALERAKEQMAREIGLQAASCTGGPFKPINEALTAYRTVSPDPVWQSGETFPRDNAPFLYWDEDCAIPETVAFLNGSKIAQHGLYPYAGGGLFVSEERAKGGWWCRLPTPPVRARGEG